MNFGLHWILLIVEMKHVECLLQSSFTRRVKKAAWLLRYSCGRVIRTTKICIQCINRNVSYVNAIKGGMMHLWPIPLFIMASNRVNEADIRSCAVRSVKVTATSSEQLLVLSVALIGQGTAGCPAKKHVKTKRQIGPIRRLHFNQLQNSRRNELR